jgi:hypothetical protein
MSLTPEERERWRIEIERLNREGWAEHKRMLVEAVRKANQTWTFERSWDAVEREQRFPASEPSTQEVRSRVPFHQVEAAARQLMVSQPRLTFGAALILAREQTPEDPAVKDARSKLEEEKERHRQMESGQTAEEIEKHTKVLALARKLMSRDTSMGIDEAIRRVYRENPSLVPVMPGKTASARYAAPLESSYLVRAEHAVQFDGLPAVIQYMPPGRSTICPSVDGKPKQITVNVGPGTAAALQADLIRLLSENVRPFIDFNHSEGAAAAIPKRFFWKDGEGVMLELDWTGAGKTAVAGRDFSHFSATFTLSKDGDAINLPPSGPVGSLVNNPAFRSGKRLMAMAR